MRRLIGRWRIRCRCRAWLGDGQVAISGGVPDGAQVVTAGAALLDAAMPVSAWAGAVR